MGIFSQSAWNKSWQESKLQHLKSVLWKAYPTSSPLEANPGITGLTELPVTLCEHLCFPLDFLPLLFSWAFVTNSYISYQTLLSVTRLYRSISWRILINKLFQLCWELLKFEGFSVKKKRWWETDAPHHLSTCRRQLCLNMAFPLPFQFSVWL